MAKQIIGLAQQGDIWRAIQIANHGRELCTVETILEQYYYKLANLEHSMNKPSGMRGNPSDEAIFKRDAERELKSGKNAICKIFIEAVNTYDGAKILEIAKAVWFLRKSGVAIRGGEDFVRADNERYLLLFLTAIPQAG